MSLPVSLSDLLTQLNAVLDERSSELFEAHHSGAIADPVLMDKLRQNVKDLISWMAMMSTGRARITYIQTLATIGCYDGAYSLINHDEDKDLMRWLLDLMRADLRVAQEEKATTARCFNFPGLKIYEELAREWLAARP